MKTIIYKFFAALLSLVALAAPSFGQEAVSIKLFKPGGDQVDWCKSTGRIAYASRGRDNCYGIHTCSPTGDDDIWITKDNSRVPPGQKGSPGWHPSGKYIVFTAEKPKHPGGSFASTPGLGSCSDLWLITTDGSRAWQLTDLPMTKDDGLIIPKFSHDGKRLVWAQRVEKPKLLNPTQFCGFWDIKVADFSDAGPTPKLSNIKTFRPGGKTAFNETYGFSPDDKSIIFCSDFNQHSFWTSQIFTCDADTGADIVQLTKNSYNEHACYFPDGAHIVWMTNLAGPGGTDWWTMNADGSGKKQLTFFNKRGHKEYQGKRLTCGLCAFSPDGKQMLGGVQNNLIKQTGDSYMVTLK